MEDTCVRLYGCGSNGSGQLGCGHRNDLSEPQLCHFAQDDREKLQYNDTISDHLPHGDSVKRLVAGGNHTLILTSKGRVYAAGNNENGLCGMVDGLDSLTVYSVVSWALGRNITNCAATWGTSLFVEDTQVVWTCGSGSKGELGLGEGCLQSQTPAKVFDSKQVSNNCTIVDISGSMGHVIVVLSNGEAYGWGSCRRGQLGSSLQARKILWKPQRLDLSFAATGAIAGRDFSFCWSSKQDQILLGDLKADNNPQQLRLKSENCQPFAGWSTIYVLNEGEVQGCGQGRRGQLPPANLPQVTTLAAGSEHCVALTRDGKVVAWGWGEHGNCGLPLDHRGVVQDCFNFIPIPSKGAETITGVGAGCATSFAWTST